MAMTIATDRSRSTPFVQPRHFGRVLVEDSDGKIYMSDRKITAVGQPVRNRTTDKRYIWGSDMALSVLEYIGDTWTEVFRNVAPVEEREGVDTRWDWEFLAELLDQAPEGILSRWLAWAATAHPDRHPNVAEATNWLLDGR